MFRVDGTTVFNDALAVSMPLEIFANAWIAIFTSFDRDTVPQVEYLDEYRKPDGTPLTDDEKSLLALILREYASFFDSFVRADELMQAPEKSQQPVSDYDWFMLSLLVDLQRQDPRFLKIRPLDLRVWWTARGVVMSNEANFLNAQAEFQKALIMREKQDAAEGRTGFLPGSQAFNPPNES